METGRNNKRSSSASDDEERPNTARVDEGDERKVTDEEVEEFYAILRRIREASRGFAVGKDNRGGGGGGRGGAPSWVPAFMWEDFKEGGAVNVNGTETPTNEAENNGGERRKRMEVAENDGTCPDLNAEPDTESVGRFNPESGGDSTAPFPPLSS